MIAKILERCGHSRCLSKIYKLKSNILFQYCNWNNFKYCLHWKFMETAKRDAKFKKKK